MWEEWPTVAVIVVFVTIEVFRIGYLILKNIRLKREIVALEQENVHLRTMCSELRLLCSFIQSGSCDASGRIVGFAAQDVKKGDMMSVVARSNGPIVARIPDGKHNLN